MMVRLVITFKDGKFYARIKDADYIFGYSRGDTPEDAVAILRELADEGTGPKAEEARRWFR